MLWKLVPGNVRWNEANPRGRNISGIYEHSIFQEQDIAAVDDEAGPDDKVVMPS